MGYIKFVMSIRKTDSVGNTIRACISRIESDMADTSTLETNLILHALSAPGGKIEQDGAGFPYSFPLRFGLFSDESSFPYTFPLRFGLFSDESSFPYSFPLSLK